MTLDTTVRGGARKRAVRPPLRPHKDPTSRGVHRGAGEDCRYPCMVCGRRPSELVVQVVADDGGWLWCCRQCYGRSRDRWVILGRVETALPPVYRWHRGVSPIVLSSVPRRLT